MNTYHPSVAGATMPSITNLPPPEESAVPTTDNEGREIPELESQPDAGIVKVPDAPTPPPSVIKGGPAEASPVSWYGVPDPDRQKDFRAQPVDSLDVMPSDPSALSAPVSASYSGQADESIPTPVGLEDASLPSEPVKPAPVVKASSPNKVPVPLKRTS